MKKVILALIFSSVCSISAFAWTVDFDGDGASDASGSYGVPTVPTPVYNPPPDISSPGDSSTSESHSEDISDVPAVDAGRRSQQEGDWQRRRQNTAQIQQQQTAVQQAQQAQFQQGKNDLLQNMKGSTTGALGLKAGTDYSVQVSNSTISAVQVEQRELEQDPEAWKKNVEKSIDARTQTLNKQGQYIQSRLMGKVPPLPDKKFSELQPGDVLLVAGTKPITWADNKFSGDKTSYASHTVLYLKEVNGKKLFLDSQPFGKSGPRIISEEEYLDTYGHRDTDVARLVGQPLNEKEAKQLFSAAVKMDQDNRKTISNNWFGTTMFGTNFGVWGKDDIVCAEADWLLLRSTGRNIPKSSDNLKVKLGIDFSPADFTNGRYFLVTPLELPERSNK